MIKALLNGLLTAITNLISVFCIPVDLLINTAFPDLSSSVSKAEAGITQLFSNISYALGFVPSSLIEALILILTLQVTFLGLMISYHGISRVFKVIQKIKFW